MTRFPPSAPRDSALTWLELLVVIALIPILMGLLFPALTFVPDRGKKVKAWADLLNTVAAVKQYYEEYGEYPQSRERKADITFGDSASGVGFPVSNEALYNILRNYPDMERPARDENQKQIVFLEGRHALGTPGHPWGGFATNSTGGAPGAFYDPWGNQYAIVIDGDHDGYVKVPYLDVMKESPNGVHSGCEAWSPGEDGKVGKKGNKMLKDDGYRSDDVISWQ